MQWTGNSYWLHSKEAEHAHQRCEKNRGYLGSINKQFVVVVTGAVLITVR